MFLKSIAMKNPSIPISKLQKFRTRKNCQSESEKKWNAPLKIDLTNNVHQIIFMAVNMATVIRPERRIKIVGN